MNTQNTQTQTGEGNAPREQMRNYLNEHQYFIRGSSTVYDDRTGKAVTGEGNAPRVNAKSIHDVALNFVHAYTYGRLSIEQIAGAIRDVTGDNAALVGAYITLEVASYLPDTDEQLLRKALRNEIL